MVFSKQFLLVAGMSILLHTGANQRKVVCILLKCVSSTVLGVFLWRSATSNQPLQTTTSTQTASDGSCQRDRLVAD